jgi:site-specific recombinase XerD
LSTTNFGSKICCLTYCIKKSRTFAGDLLDADVELVTVEKFMGHSDVNTTDGYDRRGEVAKRGAVKKLHVPYKRRYASITS